MDRRALLRRALLVGTVGLAGCGGPFGGSTPETTTGQSDADRGFEVVDDRTVSAAGAIGGFADIVSVTDGAVAVGTQTDSSGKSRGWVYSVDDEGQRRWQRTDGSGPTQLDAVVSAPNGDVLTVGHEFSQSDSSDPIPRGWVQRLGPDGTRRWAGTYSGSGETLLKGGVGTADGFLLVGVTNVDDEGSGDGWLLRLDDAGEEIDTAVFDEGYFGVFNDVVAAGSGQYVAVGAGSRRRGPQSNGLVVAVDGNLEPRYRRQPAPRVAHLLTGAVGLDDGSVVACGGANAMPRSQATEDGWLVSYGPDGSRNWSVVHDYRNGDRVWDITAGDGGRLCAVGQTNVTDRPSQEGTVVTASEDGTLESVDLPRVETDDGLTALTGITPIDDDTYLGCGTRGARRDQSGTIRSAGWLLKVSV